MVVAAILSLSSHAIADSPTNTRPGLSVDTRAHGLYVAIGPVGVIQRSESNWDSAFGGELTIVHINEALKLTAVGLAMGATGLSERDGGRLWLGGMVGSERLPGAIPMGLAAGGIVEVDAVRHPRYGAYATVWFYVGVMPFFRVSTIQKSGSGVEIGLAIPLPALKL